jgi:hypothetical protein
MTLPGFTAERSMYRSGGRYRHEPAGGAPADTVVPAIPFCGNCDWILDRCERNGWRPRALCFACLTGNCFSGVEDPTPEDPFTPAPWRW